MKKKDEQLGEAAYNAYCYLRNNKSVKGESLPVWGEQDPELQKAWIAAAQAVVDMHQSLSKSTYVGQ